MFSLHHDYFNKRTNIANPSVENMALLKSFGANLEQIYKNRPPRYLEGRL